MPISERSEAIEVSKTLYQGNAEVGETTSQERISERRQVFEVPNISCQESVEVDPDLLRTVMQYLDTGRESPSRFFERIREGISEQAEKKKILRFFSPSEEGLPS